jgi:hypothetical protein
LSHISRPINTKTQDWELKKNKTGELYMAPMAFAYNISFHRPIKISPFTLTNGIEPRTIELNARSQYGEKLRTELYQNCSIAMNNGGNWQHSDTAIGKNKKNHKKKHTQENSKKVNGYCKK